MIAVQRRHQALRRLRGARRRLARGPDGSLTALLGPVAARASRRCCASSPGSRRPTPARVVIDGDDATGAAAAEARHRLRLPALRRVQAHDRARQRRVRPERSASARRREIDARVDELLGIVGLAGYAERYPSQLSGGQRQRMALARALAVEPSVLLLDEPFGALDAKVRAELRAWLRRLHDEVHVTTVLVTHDQEEAMEVADRIAVMNDGPHRAGRRARASSTSARRTTFVMGFLGPVTRLGDELVRPHDVDDRAAAGATARRGAWSTRVVHLGFEVRVELELADGGEAHGAAHARRGRRARAGRRRHRVRPTVADERRRRAERLSA